MERKSLKDISWNVTEAEYRADSALSQSTLTRYEREGFNNLSKLFDKIESPSLTFGSAVDCRESPADYQGTRARQWCLAATLRIAAV